MVMENDKIKLCECGCGESVALGRKFINHHHSRVYNPMKGKKHSAEARMKMSLLKRGIPKSEEHKRKIGLGNKGKIISLEQREKLRIAHTGKKLSEDHKRKISEAISGEKNYFYGKKHPSEVKIKISQNRIKNALAKGENNPMYGRKHSVETKLKISHIQKLKHGINQLSENWDIIITPMVIAIRSSHEYREWRKKIYKRDKYICQNCNKKYNKLHAHHHKMTFSQILKNNNIQNIDDAIKCPDLWNIDNGITLCVSCHRKEHRKN